MSESAAKQYWVVKVGSALVTAPAAGLNGELIGAWAAQIAELKRRRIDCVVVSSGAIIAGMQRLGWQQRPHALHQQQAAAAVGQSALANTWESALGAHDLAAALVLLTHADLANRERYLNSRNTLRTLLNLDVVPVINENDTVVVDEIRLGDNDTLAALVANLVEARRLVLLTDQIGLLSKDPREHKDAELIAEARAGDRRLEALAGPSGEFGRGGMRTKLAAAQKAARSGTDTVIASGREIDVLTRIADGERIGTSLQASGSRIAARKQWLAEQRDRGTLWLDEGAVRVLRDSGRSLLSVGVVSVQGQFARGDLVICRDSQGTDIARGLINYGAEDTKKIIGLATHQMEQALGFVDEPELIHRDNMVLE